MIRALARWVGLTSPTADLLDDLAREREHRDRLNDAARIGTARGAVVIDSRGLPDGYVPPSAAVRRP